MVSPAHLALLKAEYAYTPQSDDEIALEEDMYYYLLDDTDPEWFKVKLKVPPSSPNPPRPGLVPANYVIPALPLRLVTAIYAYDAQTDDELTIKEDDSLDVYEDDGEWSLVSRCSQEDNKGVGYVPTSYLGNAERAHSKEPGHPPSIALSIPHTSAGHSSASHQAVPQSADVATWSVTDIDHKKKKRKGTLTIDSTFLTVVGESEKMGVQKYDMSTVSITKTEKGKHLILQCGSQERHFQVSQDHLDEIVSKIQIVQQGAQSFSSSKNITLNPAFRPPSAMASPDKPPASSIRKVSFATPIGKPATALYDFEAQGDDELTVEEGDRLLVLDDISDDDWWKCANQSNGQEGVVPASYIELDQGQPSGNQEAAEAAIRAAAASDAKNWRIQEEENARLAQKLADENRSELQLENARAADRKLLVARQTEQRINAEAQLATLRKKESESRRREPERAISSQNISNGPAPPRLTPRPNSAQGMGFQDDNAPTPSPPRRPDSAPREGRSKPQGVTRTWRDRTGQFKVEAEFLGLQNGKIRLHKLNGITIEVPLAKISSEDVIWLEGATGRTLRGQDTDDIPLANLTLNNNLPTPRPTPVDASKLPNTPLRPPIDWFEFFLNAGCDLDDCTRYASNFERDRIDENLLPDLESSTMRNLGLREGDVIRVQKHIKQKYMNSDENGAVSSQIRKDEELARKLQQQVGSAPNIFTNGSNGSLKTTRRGRPTPSRSGSSLVDVSSLENVKDKLIDTIQPEVTSSATNLPVLATFSTNGSGFDDDAWQIRPNSTTPAAAPTENPPLRPASASTVTAKSAVSAKSPETISEAPKPSLTDEIFDKIMNHGRQSGTAPNQSVPTPPSLPSTIIPQPTNVNPNGPRGPLAPVASNAPLLNPLVPLHSGMNGFVPTRATALQSQPTGFASQNPSIITSNAYNAATPMIIQPTAMRGMGMDMSGGVGFQSQMMQPHPTGIAQPLSLTMLPIQSTGMLPQSLNTMQAPTTSIGLQPTGMHPMGSMQTQMTGYNQGFSSLSSSIPSNIYVSSLQPPPSTPAKSFNPIDIFSQMKAGQFAQKSSDSLGPQDPNKYNALRTQPTGFGSGGSFTQQFMPNDNMRQMQQSPQSGFLQQQPLPLMAQPTGFSPGGYIPNQQQTGLPGTHQNVYPSDQSYHPSHQSRGF